MGFTEAEKVKLVAVNLKQGLIHLKNTTHCYRIEKYLRSEADLSIINIHIYHSFFSLKFLNLLRKVKCPAKILVCPEGLNDGQ